jgi:hypothetical protein
MAQITDKFKLNSVVFQLGHAYFICWITESPHFKNPKVKKNKSSALSFFTCIFFPAANICVNNKNKIFFSANHISRALQVCNSTWSIKMFCCFDTGNVVLRSPGV